MAEVSGPFASPNARMGTEPPPGEGARGGKHLPVLALWWSLAGVGAGHAIVGRYDLATAWLGVRLLGAVSLAVLAVLSPPLAPYAMLGGYLWGWVVCVPAALHARRLARRRAIGRHVWLIAGPLFSVVALALLLGTNWGIRRYVVALYSIPSTSMAPALQVGDAFLAARGPFRPALRVGHVVVFPSPAEPDTLYVKRIVGLEGDVIAFSGGLLHRNGEPVDAEAIGEVEYLDECRPMRGTLHAEGDYHVIVDDRPSAMAEFGPLVVPPGEVFVAGDNRDHSGDSRSPHIGTVPVEAILGVGTAIWFSSSPCGSGEVYWDRMGTSL